MSKKCKAGHENPDSANFCRICGIPFFDDNTNEITPEHFSSIKLIPVSLVKIRFFNWILFASFAICSGLIIYLYLTMYFTPELFEENLGLAGSITLFCVSGLAWIALFIWLVRTLVHYYIFKINASYIENGNFIDKYVRVAKNTKLGLFDTKKKILSLWAHYDKIEKYDEDLLLIERNGKIGLYSLKFHKVIVPVKYTHFAPFPNSTIKASYGNTSDHYDIKGNKLK